MAHIFLDEFVTQYIETALWSSSDGDSESLEGCELATEARERMVADCEQFLALLDEKQLDVEWGHEEYSQAAHDFWLTRNHHGAGFWDGDWEKKLGLELTVLSHSFRECDLCVGDDGLVYVI